MTNDTKKKIAALNDLCRTAMDVAPALITRCGDESMSRSIFDCNDGWSGIVVVVAQQSRKRN